MLSFQQSFLRSLVSHDPSEIIQICWFCAHENISFLLLAMMKTVKLPNIFVEMDIFFWWIESLKEQHLLEIENFWLKCQKCEMFFKPKSL